MKLAALVCAVLTVGNFEAQAGGVSDDWLTDAFLCIHSHEAHSWNTNTGNGYYGGLQMDMTFQRTYAPALLRRKGPAHNWTAAEQIAVAKRAWRTRGFYPWPNTARMCGLI